MGAGFAAVDHRGDDLSGGAVYFWLFRSASMSGRILTGIIVGFVFYMLNQFLGPIALVYQWPAWIAGALPMLFFLLVYAVLLSRIK